MHDVTSTLKRRSRCQNRVSYLHILVNKSWQINALLWWNEWRKWNGGGVYKLKLHWVDGMTLRTKDWLIQSQVWTTITVTNYRWQAAQIPKQPYTLTNCSIYVFNKWHFGGLNLELSPPWTQDPCIAWLPIQLQISISDLIQPEWKSAWSCQDTYSQDLHICFTMVL